jgi:urease accessory protein
MHTHIELTCEDDRITLIRACGLLRARPLPTRDGRLRIALVQTAASLLSGDRVRIDVRLGPGTRVELIEVAGLVAHDVRGGDGAALDVDVRLGEGARLHWAAQPLVLADGCDLRRDTTVELGEGAALLMRDTLVLGRAGEEPGALRSALAVGGLHVEELDTSDRALLRSPVVAGAAKVLDTLALYGERMTDPRALQLAGAGSVLPVAASSLAASERVLAPLVDAWRSGLLAVCVA